MSQTGTDGDQRDRAGGAYDTKAPTVGSADVLKWRPAIARRRLPVNGWVYFFLGADTGQFKIGSAKDVAKRFRTLQTGCPEELSVYGVIPAVNPLALERALHKRFARFRVRGEWFYDPGWDIADFVDDHGYELEGTHRIWEEINSDDAPPPRLAPAYRL